jgi:hypothetical protein
MRVNHEGSVGIREESVNDASYGGVWRGWRLLPGVESAELSGSAAVNRSINLREERSHRSQKPGAGLPHSKLGQHRFFGWIDFAEEFSSTVVHIFRQFAALEQFRVKTPHP